MSNITHAGSSEINELVQENTRVIGQLVELVGSLPADKYQRRLGMQGQHTVGKHVRHIIDHYESFLRAIAGDGTGASVDYENRTRDPAVEADPGTACRRLAGVSDSLGGLRDRPAREPLRLDYPTASRAVGIHSSAGRELVFLFSHTVHHMAIIGLLAEQLGVIPDSDFGVHPSTLRHWRREATKLAKSA